MQKRSPRRALLLIYLGICGLCLIGALYVRNHYRGAVLPPPLPFLPTAPPYTPWPTPPVAESFDFPLLPAESYGPYVPGVTGPLNVDTRYGAQNPAQGARSNCFRDATGGTVPFSQLYHAGVDLFALDEGGQVVWGQAAHAPVHAVAEGVVVFLQDAGPDGYIVIAEHRLSEGGNIYSIYWHVDQVQVREGQPVMRGQMIGVVRHMGLNSHLHWEMRTFRDASRLFPAGTAGGRGTCNGRAAGVGYTWDDGPARAHPDSYGYLDPLAFVEAHR